MQQTTFNVKGQRVAWLDAAKGYGILLVILGHLVNTGILLDWTGVALVKGWIYSFHVPLFFFLSGYTFHHQSTFLSFVKHKCKTLLVPYLCLNVFQVLYIIICSIAKQTFTLAIPFAYYVRLLFEVRIPSMWFIPCLFWTEILFFCMTKLSQRNAVRCAIAAVMCVGGLLYYHFGGEPLLWNIDACFTAMPFFCAGYVGRIYQDKLTQPGLCTKRSWAAVAIMCLIFNIACTRVSLWLSGEPYQSLNMFHSQYGQPLFSYAAAFCGILFIIAISKLVAPRAIRYIGKNSMPYYLLNETTMLPCITTFFNAMGLVILPNSSIPLLVAYIMAALLATILGLTLINVLYVWIRKLMRRKQPKMVKHT